MTGGGHPKLKHVGHSEPIAHGEAKVRGELRYTTDMQLAGMVHLRLVLSDHPHARVMAVDTSAIDAPGFIKVYDHTNTPSVLYNSAVWYAGQKDVLDQTVLPETGRYVGDPVAAVVGETKADADAAVAALQIEYHPLDFEVDPEAVLTKPLLIHEKELAAEAHFQTGEDIERERVFAEAATVVEDRVVTPKLHHAAMENHGCLAEMNDRGGVTVYSPCQNIHAVHLIVSRVTGLPLSHVRIIKTHMGGSFGGKQEVTVECMAAVAALDLKRPVMVHLDRRDTILSTRTRTRTIGKVRTAINADGMITAREVDVVVDAGAYATNAATIGRAMGKKLFRLYRIGQQRYRSKSVYTNTPVAGPMRGYGSPQIHAITEINLDNAANAMGMDPVEFRLKNLVEPHDIDPSGGPGLGNARIRDCVEMGAEAFRWQERRRQPLDHGRFRRGVGMACGTHGNGYFGAYPDLSTIGIAMRADGSILINACLHELGHGVLTIVRQIVAEVLSADSGTIFIPEPDTDFAPYDSGCQASRVTYVTGGAAQIAANGLRDRLVRAAAELFSCSPDDVRMEDGRVWPLGSPESGLSYAGLAALAQSRLQMELTNTVTHPAQANPGSYAANFVDLEVDTLTGLVKVRDVLAVHDIGRAINPTLTQGQIYGGVQMGLGMALFEELAVDPDTGRIRADNFHRYHMVNAPDMPDVKVLLVEKEEKFGPFGAKSVGELAAVPIVPAVVNAVNHALGLRLCELPLTPERVVRALAENQT